MRLRTLALATGGLFAGLAATSLLATLFAAPIPKDKEKLKDEDTLLGTWKPDKFDNGGAPGGPPPGELDKMRFVFEKDNVIRVTGGPGGEEMKGTFKLDPTAKVKAIDLVVSEPGGKGEPRTVLGVYELDGDALKLCFAEGQKEPRPAELKADGKRVAVVTFTRVKEDKKDK
jgi:uncharacterized protein (TIGR03067 family)